jgi:hypothetical protein
MNKNKQDNEDNYIVLACPHCQLQILIYKHEINCAIFRHGIFKESGQQMNPHTPKDICDKLYEQNLIIGCGKPFRIVKNTGKYSTEICDYI